ncbi:ThuA domain-containing protein [Membranicola marinus]|uniref:ThuA domain-containing protein n=1 Tax=Membranihabitans marinus TaxID=1227546 RepID=A0A953HPY6_9BACT|nr:ThuA domain-containing protein [Membranihabitans marinus]MBY5958688.1 ThuA domain-containing protein [Membranihabitans marinus]
MNKWLYKIKEQFAPFNFALIPLLLWMVLTACSSSNNQTTPEPKNVVFLISKDPDNYEADRTIPAFAAQLEEKYNFNTEVLLSSGPRHASDFPDLSVLDQADLLVVFCRRLALPDRQLRQIQKYIEDGHPVMGIRTANHAFSVRDGTIPDGYSDWKDFVPVVLGCENRGYGPVEPGTDISVVSHLAGHTILQGIEDSYWHSTGNVYKVAPLLDDKAIVYLRGSVGSARLDEPVAWTRINPYGGKVFYSSLGHPADFDNADNVKILNQAIAWLTHNSTKK